MSCGFLSKFCADDSVGSSSGDLCKSVIDEIENILSSRLKAVGNYNGSHLRSVNPFAYGIVDMQSLDYSRESIESFKKHCRDVILDLEPRLEDVVIHDVRPDQPSRHLVINMTLLLKSSKETYTKDVIIS
jgi:predicted component of type VI protein secretion system